MKYLSTMCMSLAIYFLVATPTQATFLGNAMYCVGLLHAASSLLKDTDVAQSRGYQAGSSRLKKVTESALGDREMSQEEQDELSRGTFTFSDHVVSKIPEGDRTNYLIEKVKQADACLELSRSY